MNLLFSVFIVQRHFQLGGIDVLRINGPNYTSKYDKIGMLRSFQKGEVKIYRREGNNYVIP